MKSEKNATKVKTLRLRESLIEKIEAMAENENRNFNNMVETLLMAASANGNTKSLQV